MLDLTQLTFAVLFQPGLLSLQSFFTKTCGLINSHAQQRTAKGIGSLQVSASFFESSASGTCQI